MIKHYLNDIQILNILDVNYFKINMNLDLIYMTFLEKLFIYEIQENINNANIQKILAENKINNI